jgi:hypothetical protein
MTSHKQGLSTRCIHAGDSLEESDLMVDGGYGRRGGYEPLPLASRRLGASFIFHIRTG